MSIKTKGRFVKVPMKLVETGCSYDVYVYLFIAKRPPEYDVTMRNLECKFNTYAGHKQAMISLEWLIENKFIKTVTKKSGDREITVYKVNQ